MSDLYWPTDENDEKCKVGSFYWVLPVLDVDTEFEHWSQKVQPARFAGVSEITKDGMWYYLGVEDDGPDILEDRWPPSQYPVRWIGVELVKPTYFD